MTSTLARFLFATLTASLLLGGNASAQPGRHREQPHKTHRILAGSKSVRINNAGEVITDKHP